MKVVTREYEVYSFEELDAEAKEKVKNWYLDDETKVDTLTEIYETDLRIAFPNSDLKVQWSLSNCQGDGVNIFGTLCLEDAFKLPESNFYDFLDEYKGYFTEKEKRTINFYNSLCSNDITLPVNRYYTYCKASQAEIAYNIVDILENENIRNINMHVVNKLEKYIIDMITDICEKMKNMGYDYLYNIEEDDLKEICDCNNWCFFKDGTFFAE